ncbi:MAG TPA: NADH-quinone oxidoreductase subunit M, partial [Verrucomicrobia bacterium]|nr:NADH-quinone oxidoreductase subunit M [Verrucomicrobiota bacterium]
LWPFHSWAPIGYGAAPTAVAMVHAGVLKKFGIYSLIRIAVPLLPAGMQGWLHVIAFLCLGNILYCGLVAIRQKDLNLLIGNSSVAHMGFVFLGIAALNVIGITGAVVVMVAHGLLAALSFGISGYLCRQTQDPQMDRMAGMLSRLPFIGTALIMALLAGCGLPGFGNFVGELLVFFGAIKSFPVVTAFALWGALVIGAVYMLRAVRTLMHGEVSETAKSIKDAETSWQRLPFVLLLGVLLLFGCFPGLLTDKIRPSVEAILEQARQQGAPKMEGKAAFPLDDVPENIVNFDPIK